MFWGLWPRTFRLIPKTRFQSRDVLGPSAPNISTHPKNKLPKSKCFGAFGRGHFDSSQKQGSNVEMFEGIRARTFRLIPKTRLQSRNVLGPSAPNISTYPKNEIPKSKCFGAFGPEHFDSSQKPDSKVELLWGVRPRTFRLIPKTRLQSRNVVGPSAPNVSTVHVRPRRFQWGRIRGPGRK